MGTGPALRRSASRSADLACRPDDAWHNDKTGQGGGYSHLSAPDEKACLFKSDPESPDDLTLIGASSNHPGGVNYALLDGSVRFIKNTVSPNAWWALATKSGGEVLSADQY